VCTRGHPTTTDAQDGALWWGRFGPIAAPGARQNPDLRDPMDAARRPAWVVASLNHQHHIQLPKELDVASDQAP